MIRIDDEKADLRVRRQFFPFGNIIVGRDARRPAGPSVHLFSSERGPALIRAAGVNQEINAGTLKNNVPASIDSPASPPLSK